MGKYILWILLAAIAVVVFVLAFNYVRDQARPPLPSPEELERIETEALSDLDWVVITLDDGLYHRPNCTQIRGSTEKVVFKVAREQGLRPCPVCIGE